MIKRDDFIFTLGYQGSTAIVDRVLKSQNPHASLESLIEKNLLKSALAFAIYEQSEEQCEKILQVYNEKIKEKITSVAALKKAFGVDRIPEEIDKVTLI